MAWSYRIVEVLIKAVIGLFAGIGMVLGSFFGQGLMKTEHRQKFANTFFVLDQKEEWKTVASFKKEMLGDDQDELGLISVANFQGLYRQD